MEEGTFKERYLAGEIPFEEIDRYISRWNNSDDPRTLAQYLGLNAEEEDAGWAEGVRKPLHVSAWRSRSSSRKRTWTSGFFPSFSLRGRRAP